MSEWIDELIGKAKQGGLICHPAKASVQRELGSDLSKFVCTLWEEVREAGKEFNQKMQEEGWPYQLSIEPLSDNTIILRYRWTSYQIRVDVASGQICSHFVGAAASSRFWIELDASRNIIVAPSDGRWMKPDSYLREMLCPFFEYVASHLKDVS